MDAAIEAGAEDVVTNEDGSIEVITGPNDLTAVRGALDKAGFKPELAEVTMKPATENELERRRRSEDAAPARCARRPRRRAGGLHHRGHATERLIGRVSRPLLARRDVRGCDHAGGVRTQHDATSVAPDNTKRARGSTAYAPPTARTDTRAHTWHRSWIARHRIRRAGKIRQPARLRHQRLHTHAGRRASGSPEGHTRRPRRSHRAEQARADRRRKSVRQRQSALHVVARAGARHGDMRGRHARACRSPNTPRCK